MFVAVMVAAFFLVRAVVTFIEEGRWPKRAAGVEVDDLDAALDEVEKNADDMSTAASSVRALERRLKEAHDLNHYLWTELQRARGTGVEVRDERRRANDDQL